MTGSWMPASRLTAGSSTRCALILIFRARSSICKMISRSMCAFSGADQCRSPFARSSFYSGPIDTLPSGLAGQQVGEPLQVQRPASIAANTVAHAFPAFTMAFQFSVLDLDAGPVRGQGGEPHFPLTGLVRIGLDLPLRADVPAQEHPVGRFIGQHACPAALAAVNAAIIEVAADPRLEH